MPKTTNRKACREQNLSTYQGYPCKKGHDGTRHISHGQCVQCYSDKLAAMRSRSDARYGSKSKHPGYQLLKEAKKRAKECNREIDLRLEDIIVPERCPISGRLLAKHTSDAPSLDRIDNSKGYVLGNVAVISHRMNSIKNSATIEELRAVLAYMEQHEAAIALVD